MLVPALVSLPAPALVPESGQLPVPALVPVAVSLLVPALVPESGLLPVLLPVDTPCVPDVQRWKGNQTQLSLVFEVIPIQNTKLHISGTYSIPPTPPSSKQETLLTSSTPCNPPSHIVHNISQERSGDGVGRR